MTDSELLAEVGTVRAEAECLADMATVSAAMDGIAAAVSDTLCRRNPLLLGVMTGGAVPLSMLLCRLDFPLQVDYAHLTRYGMHTTGGELLWVKQPPDSVRDRTVLLVDDLLDHGVTLQAMSEACRARGATDVLTAVLVTKEVADRPGLQQTDFSGLSLPDRYLFGCGMDYKSYLRNAPGVFAVRDQP